MQNTQCRLFIIRTLDTTGDVVILAGLFVIVLAIAYALHHCMSDIIGSEHLERREVVECTPPSGALVRDAYASDTSRAPETFVRPAPRIPNTHMLYACVGGSAIPGKDESDLWTRLVDAVLRGDVEQLEECIAAHRVVASHLVPRGRTSDERTLYHIAIMRGGVEQTPGPANESDDTPLCTIKALMRVDCDYYGFFALDRNSVSAYHLVCCAAHSGVLRWLVSSESCPDRACGAALVTPGAGHWGHGMSVMALPMPRSNLTALHLLAGSTAHPEFVVECIHLLQDKVPDLASDIEAHWEVPLTSDDDKSSETDAKPPTTAVDGDAPDPRHGLSQTYARIHTGDTALHAAVRLRAHPSIVVALARGQVGCDPNRCNADGDTPIWLAIVEMADADTACALLDAGASIYSASRSRYLIDALDGPNTSTSVRTARKIAFARAFGHWKMVSVKQMRAFMQECMDEDSLTPFSDTDRRIIDRSHVLWKVEQLGVEEVNERNQRNEHILAQDGATFALVRIPDASAMQVTHPSCKLMWPAPQPGSVVYGSGGSVRFQLCTLDPRSVEVPVEVRIILYPNRAHPQQFFTDMGPMTIIFRAYDYAVNRGYIKDTDNTGGSGDDPAVVRIPEGAAHVRRLENTGLMMYRSLRGAPEDGSKMRDDGFVQVLYDADDHAWDANVDVCMTWHTLPVAVAVVPDEGDSAGKITSAGGVALGFVTIYVTVMLSHRSIMAFAEAVNERETERMRTALDEICVSLDDMGLEASTDACAPSSTVPEFAQ